MSRHTAQSLASHLAASWSTAEKRKERSFDLSLAREILDLDIGNYHIPARLIILLTARGCSEDVFRTIAPYLETATARENWPLAVSTASVHKSYLQDRISSLTDPLENVVHRLSTLSISPAILQGDPSFATPLELAAINLNAFEGKSANNQPTLEMRPVRQHSHYVPSTDNNEPFDYLVELEVKVPPSKPRVVPVSKPPPPPPISPSPRPAMASSTFNSNSLVKLGSRGPNAGRPDLRRRQLSIRSFPLNASEVFQNTGAASSFQRRPSVESSITVNPNAAIPSAASRVTGNSDVAVPIVDLTLEANASISPNRSLSPRDVIKPEYPEEVDYPMQTKDEPHPTFQPPKMSMENFRAKLNQRKTSESSKTMVFDNTDKMVLEPDTVFMRNQLRQKRANERAEKAKQKREREAAREALRTDRAVERKRKRLSLHKKQPRSSNDMDEDVKPAAEKKEDDIIILDEIDGGVNQNVPSRTARSPRRFTRSSANVADINQPPDTQQGSMVKREHNDGKRDRLFNSIRGHTDDLSNQDRRTIEDFLQGNNDIFGIQSTLLILLHRDCNGADHYIRLSREPRLLEEVKMFPS